jgi:hypothetical protein
MILPLLAVLLVGSPDCKLHVVDQAGTPLTGIRVVRAWETSEGKKGTAEALTDTNGEVSFPKIETSISALTKVFKPLLVFVPASCGPSSEIYGLSTFRVYAAKYYTPHFDGKIWKRESEVWVRSDGLCIRDPAEERKYHPNDSYQELYFFNHKTTFDFTLVLYADANQPP